MVGNKTIHGVTEGVKAAFQSFDEQNLHEPTQVLLGLYFELTRFLRSFVIGHGHIAGVFQFLRDEPYSFVENFVFFLVELIEYGFGSRHLWEPKPLLLQILGKVAFDLLSGASHHQVFQNLFADDEGVFFDGLHVFFAITLSVQCFDFPF